MEVGAAARRPAQGERDHRHRTGRAARDPFGQPASADEVTSHTLQITFSIVNPGEVAKAHRHNMAAIRFVVQGKGAYTAVDGEKFYMEEGDLILTPNWTWHDHHNESEDPIIWLDGLDGPLIQSLNILFFEDSATTRTADHPANRRVARPHGLCAPTEKRESHRRGVPFRYSFKETHGH